MNKQLLFEQLPHLEDKNLILKKVEPKDANDLFEILTNRNLYKFAPGKPLKNLDAVKNVIGHYERDFNKHKTLTLGIYCKVANNKLVGVISVFGFDYKASRVELGCTINENFGGIGTATDATKLVLEFLFNTIGVNSVKATAMPINEKSNKVLRKCGFIHEGTLRQVMHWTGIGIVDLEMYSILKSDYVK